MRARSRPFDDPQHFLGIEGFDLVIESAEPGGFDGGRHRALAGENDYRQFQLPLFDLPQRFQSVHARHTNVENRQVERLAIEARQRR